MTSYWDKSSADMCIVRQYLQHNTVASRYGNSGTSAGTDHGTGDYSFTCSYSYTSLNYAHVMASDASSKGKGRSNHTDRDAVNIIATICKNAAGSYTDDGGRIVCTGDV